MDNSFLKMKVVLIKNIFERSNGVRLDEGQNPAAIEFPIMRGMKGEVWKEDLDTAVIRPVGSHRFGQPYKYPQLNLLVNKDILSTYFQELQ